MANENSRLVTDGPCRFIGRALLVRRTQQVHRGEINRQTKGEEPGGEVKGLIIFLKLTIAQGK